MSALLALPRELRDEILDFAIRQPTRLDSRSHPLSIFEISGTPTPSPLHHPARGLLFTCHHLRAETLQRNAKHFPTIEFDAASEDWSSPCTSISMPVQLGPVIEKVYVNCRMCPICLDERRNNKEFPCMVRCPGFLSKNLGNVSEDGISLQIWRILLHIIHGTPSNTLYRTPTLNHAVEAVHIHFSNEPGAQKFVDEKWQEGVRYGLLSASHLAENFRCALVTKMWNQLLYGSEY
jgi:hypothetical protein